MVERDAVGADAGTAARAKLARAVGAAAGAGRPPGGERPGPLAGHALIELQPQVAAAAREQAADRRLADPERRGDLRPGPSLQRVKHEHGALPLRDPLQRGDHLARAHVRLGRRRRRDLVQRHELRAAHGLLPNPAPAVVQLLRGAPTHGVDVPVELTTPTGAALVATLATGWGPLPPMRIEATGFGTSAAHVSPSMWIIVSCVIADRSTGSAGCVSA